MACIKCQVMVLLRFNDPMFQTLKNSLIKQLMVTNNYGGRVVGVASSESLTLLTGDWPADKGVVVLVFPTMVEARRWEHSTPDIRQNDWLGGVDILAFPCKSAPASYHQPLQLVSFRPYPAAPPLYTEDNEHTQEIPKIMQEHNVINMIMSETPERLRGCWEPCLFMLNQFPSVAKYNQFSDNPVVQELRVRREECGHTTMVLVQLKALK